MQLSETSLRRLLVTFPKVASVPISGLVITFDSPVENHTVAIESLREIPEIEIGAGGGGKLAIVVDSENKRRDQEIWFAVRELPGVIDLAVAMVAFDEDSEQDRTEPIRNQR